MNYPKEQEKKPYIMRESSFQEEAIRFYRKVDKAIEKGKKVEIEKSKDGKMKVLQVSKTLI
jgi:hypothetical protein